MKVKIIKRYELYPGRFWEVDQLAEVDNELGPRLVKEGFANEIRIQCDKDDRGNDQYYEVEILDKQGSTRSKKIDKEKII
jgi:hypothetical protein